MALAAEMSDAVTIPASDSQVEEAAFNDSCILGDDVDNADDASSVDIVLDDKDVLGLMGLVTLYPQPEIVLMIC